MSDGRCTAPSSYGSVVGVQPGVSIRPARPEELPAAAALLASSLGFPAADALPPWLIRTTDGCGGLTLIAASDDTVIGVSYAFPGRDGTTSFLFSCGLAVAPSFRRRGIARALKLEQRRQALRRGIEVIRWTADPLNGPGLALYLSGLRARLTAYHAGLYDGLRAGNGVPQDDVEIEWRLTDGPLGPVAPGVVVEVPTRGGRLERRLRVREAMIAALADGAVGVAAEPSAGGFVVRFER